MVSKKMIPKVIIMGIARMLYWNDSMICRLRIALNALVKQGALLPSVAIHAPSRVVGKNTDECMRSGIVIGSASMIDGMIDRIEEEIGKKCSLVATGGLAAEIVPSCRHKIELRDDLMLQGLRLIFEKNKK